MHEHEHQQDENETDQLKELSMDDDDAIKELTYLLLQTGDHIRNERSNYHPPSQRDLTNMFDHNGGINSFGTIRNFEEQCPSL